ncbi:MAG: carbonic anhydrase, partial [Pseudomonadota bacterium]|nr:carbonic anhydrase [Pseudomonadota bacterium]
MKTEPLIVFFVLTLTVALTGFVATGAVHAETANVALTREAQAAITPGKALEMLKQGNERFVSGKAIERDYLAQVKQTSKGQFPFAAVVSCLDSRI